MAQQSVSEDLRWWCKRCRRGLVNDRTRRLHDTLTRPKGSTDLIPRHDGCGGDVALSKRGA